jgi:hypothetical protein
MSSSQGGFDPIGKIVDWLDACREGRRRLLTYTTTEQSWTVAKAALSADGSAWRGIGVRSWRTRPPGLLKSTHCFPRRDGVCLDYRAYDGTPVRTHFTFTKAGKIRHTVCAPIRQAARADRAEVNRLAPYKADTTSRIAR